MATAVPAAERACCWCGSAPLAGPPAGPGPDGPLEAVVNGSAAPRALQLVPRPERSAAPAAKPDAAAAPVKPDAQVVAPVCEQSAPPVATAEATTPAPAIVPEATALAPVMKLAAADASAHPIELAAAAGEGPARTKEHKAAKLHELHGLLQTVPGGEAFARHLHPHPRSGWQTLLYGRGFDKFHKSQLAREWDKLRAELSSKKEDIEEGLTYQAKDAKGAWWDVTILAKNEDGTYKAKVHENEVVYPSVHAANIRPKDDVAESFDLNNPFHVDEYTMYIMWHTDVDHDGTIDWRGLIAWAVAIELCAMIGCFFAGCAVTESDGDICDWLNTYWSTYDCLSKEDLRSQVKRLVLYTWTHNNLAHLTTNCITLVFFAYEFELAWGFVRTACVFFVGGLTGAWLFTVDGYLHGEEKALVGASGAIYAFVGDHFANLLLNQDSMSMFDSKIHLFFATAALGMEIYHYMAGTLSGVSYVCHVGGCCGGFLVGLLVLPNLHVRGLEEQHRRGLALLGIVLSVALVSKCYATALDDACP